MARKKIDKMEKLEEIMEEAAHELAMEYGGYPSAIGLVGDYLIEATADEDGEADFSAYSRAACEEWYDNIRRFRRQNPDESITIAIEETRPRTVWEEERDHQKMER